MNPRFTLLLCMLFLLGDDPSIYAQLSAGPFQGHYTSSGISFWLMVHKTDTVTATLLPLDQKVSYRQTLSTHSFHNHKGHTPIQFQFEALSPSSIYAMILELDGKQQKDTTYFKTAPAVDSIYDLRFMIGSCDLAVPLWLKPFHPGNEDRIYRQMRQEKTDFMLWLGDYLYYMGKDFTGFDRMFERFVDKRLRERHMKFMQSRPQYSIWDDHEYGPNDSDRRWLFKHASLEIFKSFWVNPSYGTRELPGIFTEFTHSDAHFFLLDNRFYRTSDHHPEAVMIGSAQMEWLKSALKKSTSTFKFIAIGSQVLNTKNKNECWWQYHEEIQTLFRFLKEESIEGVIFLSGDRHHAELLTYQPDNHYKFYEFTSSATISFRRRTRRTAEAKNPQRIEGTLLDFQNFGTITLTGEVGNRAALLQAYDKRGKERWSYRIHQNQLK